MDDKICVVDDKISGQPPMLLRTLGVADEKQARQAQRELARMPSTSSLTCTGENHGRHTLREWRDSAVELRCRRAGCRRHFSLLR